MMKTFLTFLLLSLSLNVPADKEAITPYVGERFGDVVTIEAEFIEKPNTYHHQNMVQEPFLVSVLKVNGTTLEEPITMEYVTGHQRAGFKLGTVYQLKAYETIYDIGIPGEWSDEVVSQIDYRLIHRLIIKRAEEEANRGIVIEPSQNENKSYTNSHTFKTGPGISFFIMH